LSRFLSEIANLDFEILISKLDVNNAPNGADVRDRDKAIAEEAERFLGVALAQKKVRTLLTWGLSDRYTWWHGASNPHQNVLARPLPLDANLQCKPLCFTIAKATRNAPSR
jgi:endo-1,4-beta-xylanase